MTVGGSRDIVRYVASVRWCQPRTIFSPELKRAQQAAASSGVKLVIDRSSKTVMIVMRPDTIN